MAWTAPMTFVANQPLSAAQLNTHLRDNMFETEASKVTTDGQYLTTVSRNKILQRSIGTGRIDTTETTTSTDYTDLATVGPAGSVRTGSKALVFTSVNIFNSVTAAAGGMSFDVHGVTPEGEDGTDLEPKDSWQCLIDGVTLTSGNSAANAVLITVVPGHNVFTCKYKVGSGTGSFRYRDICVFPF